MVKHVAIGLAVAVMSGSLVFGQDAASTPPATPAAPRTVQAPVLPQREQVRPTKSRIKTHANPQRNRAARGAQPSNAAARK
jgi:hypothetical protein